MSRSTQQSWSEPRAWRYELAEGWVALAGKTDVDNDQLSLRVARAGDWWFHVRGLPGSHVILQSAQGARPDSALIKRAAAIAAWHSKARNAGVVPVSCTDARHVSKPRGAKAGLVTLRRETVVKVRPALPGIAGH